MNSNTELILSMILLGTVTFLYRFSFISHKGKALAEKIPEDFLNLLAPATFAAIIANNILAHQSDPNTLKQKVSVAILSLGVAYYSKNIVLTLIFGLGLLWALQNY